MFSMSFDKEKGYEVILDLDKTSVHGYSSEFKEDAINEALEELNEIEEELYEARDRLEKELENENSKS